MSFDDTDSSDSDDSDSSVSDDTDCGHEETKDLLRMKTQVKELKYEKGTEGKDTLIIFESENEDSSASDSSSTLYNGLSLFVLLLILSPMVKKHGRILHRPAGYCNSKPQSSCKLFQG